MSKLKKIIGEDLLFALDDIRAGMLFTDLQGNVIHANKSLLEMFGVDLKSILNKRCCEVIHPMDNECKNCIESDNIQICRFFSDTEKHYMVSSSIIKNKICLKIIKDITNSQNKFNKMAEELVKLKTIVSAVTGDENVIIICAQCKKCRMLDGSWIRKDSVDQLSGAMRSSHGLCPECACNSIETLRSFRDFLRERQ